MTDSVRWDGAGGGGWAPGLVTVLLGAEGEAAEGDGLVVAGCGFGTQEVPEALGEASVALTGLGGFAPVEGGDGPSGRRGRAVEAEGERGISMMRARSWKVWSTGRL